MSSGYGFLIGIAGQLVVIAGISTMFVWMVTVAGRAIGGRIGLYAGAALGVSITSTPFVLILANTISAMSDPVRWANFRLLEHWPISLAIALASIAPILMLCLTVRRQLALAKA